MPTFNAPSQNSRCLAVIRGLCTVLLSILAVSSCVWASASTTPARIEGARRDSSVPEAPPTDELPDTPVPTCQNGKPYQPGTLAKLVGSCPFDKKPEVKWDGIPDRFWTLAPGRTLHPSRKAWVLFAGAHAALWGATVFAVRRHATSGELAESEYPAVAGCTVLDLVLFRTVSPVFSLGTPIYGIAHYLHSGLK